MEILKVKLSETQTLIAYYSKSVATAGRVGVVSATENSLEFKVGPNSSGQFVDCSPDAVMALLAMLGRQEKPSTP